MIQLHSAGVTGMVVPHESKSVSILLFDEGFTIYMAIYKTHQIIRKRTPIPLSTMPWVLYASGSNTQVSNVNNS
jgi:hypothetical protein